MDRGFCPIYARERDGLTKEYYNLGGNGVVHKLVDKLQALPTYYDRQKHGEEDCGL